MVSLTQKCQRCFFMLAHCLPHLFHRCDNTCFFKRKSKAFWPLFDCASATKLTDDKMISENNITYVFIISYRFTNNVRRRSCFMVKTKIRQQIYFWLLQQKLLKSNMKKSDGLYQMNFVKGVFLFLGSFQTNLHLL